MTARWHMDDECNVALIGLGAALNRHAQASTHSTLILVPHANDERVTVFQDGNPFPLEIPEAAGHNLQCILGGACAERYLGPTRAPLRESCPEIWTAIVRLSDQLCEWERNTGRGSSLFVVLHKGGDEFYMAQDGKPIPASSMLSPAEVLRFALAGREPDVR